MAILNDRVRKQVMKEFADLKEEVKLLVFTQEMECQYCRENRALAEEIASLSDKISIEVYDFVADKEPVERYSIDKVPAIAVVGDRDYGIRFYGVPAGYEFGSLIEAIKMVSARDSGLSPESREGLKKLDKPVHIQVFVTLTCPYCPHAVRLAHKMAFESDLVRADMVEASEFPHLANRYSVFAVPKVVINEEIQFEGALPEPLFLEKVMEVTRQS